MIAYTEPSPESRQ